jgi:hypothetical protein
LLTHRKYPRARWREGRSCRSFLRAQDQGVDLRVVLTCLGAQVGVECLGAELRSGEGERHVLLAERLAFAGPSGTDLDALAHDWCVWAPGTTDNLSSSS